MSAETARSRWRWVKTAPTSPCRSSTTSESEPTETFVVSIINVDSASTILYPRTARIEILDDENPVSDPASPPLTSNYVVTEQVVVSGLNQPIAFEFAPHDPSLIYIAEKGGVIKVFDTDTGAQSTFIDISSEVNNIQDRGLMDIALHPDFGTPVEPGQPEHNYVYAFYVVDPPDTIGNTNSNAGPDGGGNRFAYLVRYTADPATNYTTVLPDSEVILLGGAGQTLRTSAAPGPSTAPAPAISTSRSPGITPKQGNTSMTTSRSIRAVTPADHWRSALTALSMCPSATAHLSTQRTRALPAFRTSTVCRARSCASTRSPVWDCRTTRLSSLVTTSTPTIRRSTSWA